MYITATFIPLTKTLELVKPGQTAFDNPASFTQAAAVLGVTFCQQRNYSQFPQCLSQRFTMIGPVTLKTIRSFSRTARLTTDRRDGIYQHQCLCNIMPVCPRELMGKGNAICIGNQMVLGTCFTPVCGIRAGLLPPKTALTEAESTTALEKSIWLLWRNLARRIWCILSQTPAFCQSRKRRQQVIPLPQPISCGKYSQPMPVLNTNNIPVRAARSEICLRPGYRNLRLRFGMSGSISDHNCSSNIGFAMSVLLKIQLLMTSAKYLKKLLFC
jgi:hypothetical protein